MEKGCKELQDFSYSEILDEVAVHVGKAVISPLMVAGESFVIES